MILIMITDFPIFILTYYLHNTFNNAVFDLSECNFS